MVLVYDRIRVHRRQLGKSASAAGTVVFVAGYISAWTGFGLLGYTVYEVFASLSIDFLEWDRGGRWLAGGLIAMAGIYELTPAKDVCLRKCRSPFEFVMGGWKDGLPGALRLGVSHGAWCIGCCWGLMVALFALGVMSIAWMAFVAALIATEKLLPWAPGPSRVIAVLLVTLGLAVAIVPDRVPGLSEPGMHHGGMSGHDAGM
jgi:predicted metal-binding membrane protein